MIFAAITRTLAAVGLSERLSRILAPWVAGAAVIALVALVMALMGMFVRQAFDRATDQGVQQERAETNAAIIRHIEEAQDARQENLSRTDDQRIADCLRRSRTPENCK
jgi:Na+-transporting methylmalonyl-CoA/oxaloacetate decarboxylase gamma subunit